MADPEPDFVLHLRVVPGAVPGTVRLRHALKLLLRVCRLRCISVQAIHPDGELVDVDALPRPEGQWP
jgi:hypothetical protein